MAKIIQHQQRQDWVPAVPPPVAEVAGIPWLIGWTPPTFMGNRLPVHEMPTEFKTLTPDTLPVGVSGSAFFRPWEPPHFPRRVPAQQQQTELRTLLPPSILSRIQGIAWYYQFDQPSQRKTPVERQQTEFRLLLPASVVAKIQGIAWRVQLSEPYFARGTKPWLQPATTFIVSPATLPVRTAGIPWYGQFVDPLRPKVFNFAYQQTEMWVRRPPPGVRGRGYIIGPG